MAKDGKAAQESGGDVVRTVAHTSAFQLIASLAVPSLIIHTQVHAFQKVFKKVGRYQKWGPVVAGLALIPIPNRYTLSAA